LIDIFDQGWRPFAIAGGLLAGLACIGLFVRRRRRSIEAGGNDGALLAMVLNNMTQGVVLVDADERLIVVNDRYVDMYGLSPEIVKPGCMLRDLIKNRISTGSLDIDPENYRREILNSVSQ
jgi:PAS domain-containing protein